MHTGPVFALARIQETIFEKLFSDYLLNSRGNSFLCEYMLRMSLHPREYRKKHLANYFLCIGFVPGANSENRLHFPPISHK